MTLLIVGLTLSSTRSAIAKPAAPEACTFVAGLAAFREAVGEDIVGDCLGDQVVSDDGGTRQRTTEGTLIWNPRQSLALFHDGFRTWVDGPGGIGSDVTIGGLSDRTISRDSLVVPAAIALDMVSLLPEDLGDDWDYVETRERATQPEPSACAEPMEPQTLGSLHTWLKDEHTGKTVYQRLTAYGGDGAERMRARFERFIAGCGERTVQTKTEPFILRMRIDTFLDIGDESMQIVFESDGQVSGARRTSRVAYVRYGGLVSQVQVWRDRAEPADSLSDLMWLAKRAHNGVQSAAWHLRP